MAFSSSINLFICLCVCFNSFFAALSIWTHFLFIDFFWSQIVFHEIFVHIVYRISTHNCSLHVPSSFANCKRKSHKNSTEEKKRKENIVLKIKLITNININRYEYEREKESRQAKEKEMRTKQHREKVKTV